MLRMCISFGVFSSEVFVWVDGMPFLPVSSEVAYPSSLMLATRLLFFIYFCRHCFKAPERTHKLQAAITPTLPMLTRAMLGKSTTLLKGAKALQGHGHPVQIGSPAFGVEELSARNTSSC